VRELAEGALKKVLPDEENEIVNVEGYRVALWPMDDGDERKRYQRQEYLGDAVVGLAVARYSFSTWPDLDEGGLTEMRARLVSRPTLAHFARCLDLSRFKVLVSERQLADCFESFVGARFLDLAEQYDDGEAYARASAFVVGVVHAFFQQQELQQPSLSVSGSGSGVGSGGGRKDQQLAPPLPNVANYKGALNNVCHKWAQSPPIYTQIGDGVPYPPHKPSFHFLVTAPVANVSADGVGATKQRAQADAAKKALHKIRNKLLELVQEYHHPREIYDKFDLVKNEFSVLDHPENHDF